MMHICHDPWFVNFGSLGRITGFYIGKWFVLRGDVVVIGAMGRLIDGKRAHKFHQKTDSFNMQVGVWRAFGLI